jgi:EAL domain-containing protein (putative c-di-GMP-specific phosphodiesterase class I)
MGQRPTQLFSPTRDGRVETPEQQAFLSDRLCDETQGFYFSTPVAAQDFAELLRAHSPKPLR